MRVERMSQYVSEHIGEEIVHISVEMNSSQNGAQLNNDRTIDGQRISIWCIAFAALSASKQFTQIIVSFTTDSGMQFVFILAIAKRHNISISIFGIQVIFQILFSSSFHMGCCFICACFCFSFFRLIVLDVTYFVFSFILIVVHLRLSFSHFNCFLLYFYHSLFIYFVLRSRNTYGIGRSMKMTGRKESGTAFARSPAPYRVEFVVFFVIAPRECLCYCCTDLYIYINLYMYRIWRACFGAHSKTSATLKESTAKMEKQKKNENALVVVGTVRCLVCAWLDLTCLNSFYKIHALNQLVVKVVTIL